MSLVSEVSPKEAEDLTKGAVITEGPGTLNFPEKKAAETTVPTETAAVTPPAEALHRVGSKEFKSKLEADAYILALEMNAASQQQFQTLQKDIQNIGKPAEDPFVFDGKKIEDLWFDDPRKAAEALYKKAVSDVRADLKKEDISNKKVQDFWTSFYKKNPDLQGADNLVKMEVDQLLRVEPNLDNDKAQDRIATAVRGQVQKLLGAYGVTRTELPKEKQSVMGPSGADGSTRAVETKPVTFLDQIKGDRRKRKTS